MLKNVVLPAPLGPMIETIERSGTQNVTSLTAIRPPNCLVTSPRVEDRRPPAVGWRLVTRAVARRVLGRSSSPLDALGELELAPSLRQQALRAAGSS